MPDITKCANNDCPLRHDCWRFTSEPIEMQSNAKFEFYVTDSETLCDYYMQKDSGTENANRL